MNLKKKAIKGSLWVSTGSFITQFVSLLIKIVLARLLLPDDFGLFAMATIFITLLNLFNGFGLGSALIFRKKNIEKSFNVAFIISPIIGIILYGISFLFSNVVASFFNEPILSTIIKIISISFIIDSFVTVPYSFLTKNMFFKQRAIADSIPILFYGIFSIFLAYNGYGVWSFVVGHLIQHCVWVALLWYFCSWRPKIIFDSKIASELINFGKYIFSASFLSFLINYIDNTLIGKRLGNENLGYYNFAFNIAAIPVNAFTHLVSSVFHPIYSKLQNDILKLKKAFMLSLKWIVLFTLPIGGGLFVLSDIFTLSIFGEKWAQMIPVLYILSFYPVLKSVNVISAYFLEGIGYPQDSTKIVLLQFIFILLFIFPLLTMYGMIGVAYVIITSIFFTMILFTYVVANKIKLTLSDYVNALWKPLVSMIIMVVVLYLIKISYIPEPIILNFLILVIIGAIIYISSNFLLDKALANEVKDLLEKAR